MLLLDILFPFQNGHTFQHKFLIVGEPVVVGSESFIPDDWVEQGSNTKNVKHWYTNTNQF